jgi:multidrug resistance efflux pump
MKDQKPEILYSDPVKEIMGNPPGKFMRWGTTILFIVFLLFIIFAWIIRYPDTIPSPVEITTVNPPVQMVSKITGRIDCLYVKNKDEVTAGQLLTLMETTASIAEVEKLKQIIDTVKKPESLLPESLPAFSDLGDIQSYWASFLKSLSDYTNYVINDFYGNKIASVAEEIKGLEEYIARVKEKERLYTENLRLGVNQFLRDSLLYVNGVYSESELEKAQQSLNNINIELQDVRLDHAAKSIELARQKQLLQSYTITRNEEREKLYSVLNQSLLNLKAQIQLWEYTFLLISPVGGVVTFTKYWSKNQSVMKDEPVLSIVPLETGDFIGRINLKMQRSGKVDTGQLVNIKLSSYPYLEYGMVRGIVISKSLVPTGDSYIIEISLPSGLTTLYDKKLDFTQNMQGTAEIITKDIRLLQKIVNPFRYLISKNKR